MDSPNYVIIVIGHSGSGKSTLAKGLSEYYSCDLLGFSYAGESLAAEERDGVRFKEINEYIFRCICATAQKCKLTIVDGLASDDIVSRLAHEGLRISILFLDTPKNIRIQRMMQRENCSQAEAASIEYAKACGKERSGLSSVIAMADYRIDGNLTTDEILLAAKGYIKEKLCIG